MAPQRKISPVTESVSAVKSATATPRFSLANPDDDHSGKSSPARTLQANLAGAFSGQSIESFDSSLQFEPVVDKFAFKWTLIGATVFCAGIWTGLYLLIV